MNRKQYLNDLYVKLRWHLPMSQVDDILCDYNEYFDAGMTEGKSEQQLCAEFGSAHQVTSNILGERYLMVKQWFRYVKVGLISLLCCSFFLFMITSRMGRDYVSFTDYHILVIFIPILLLILSGEYNLSQKKIPIKDCRKIGWIGFGGAFFSVAMGIVATLLVSQMLSETLPLSRAIFLTLYHHFILRLPALVVLVTSVLWLIKIFAVGRATNYDGVAHFLYAATAAGMCCVQRDLISCNFEEIGMAAEVFIRSIIYSVAVLLALGIACSIIWMIYIKLIGRKRRAN